MYVTRLRLTRILPKLADPHPPSTLAVDNHGSSDLFDETGMSAANDPFVLTILTTAYLISPP